MRRLWAQAGSFVAAASPPPATLDDGGIVATDALVAVDEVEILIKKGQLDSFMKFDPRRSLLGVRCGRAARLEPGG